MGQKRANGSRPKVATIQKTPPVRRRPACMDAGGRAASGTKAEESSGFNNPFPQSGNGKRVTSADREKSQFVSHPASAFLDSSLRWNDDEEKKGRLPSGNPFAIPAECLTPSPRRHSGAGRNPVVDTSHSRSAGMTLKGGIRSDWHGQTETGNLLIPPGFRPLPE